MQVTPNGSTPQLTSPPTTAASGLITFAPGSRIVSVLHTGRGRSLIVSIRPTRSDEPAPQTSASVMNPLPSSHAGPMTGSSSRQ